MLFQGIIEKMELMFDRTQEVDTDSPFSLLAVCNRSSKIKIGIKLGFMGGSMQFVNWLKSFIFSNAMNKSDLHSEIALSHNKLELFLKCKRCFYFQYKRGIKLPTLGGSFALNNAVDAFLKKEFDRYRVEQKKHDFCIKNGIN